MRRRVATVVAATAAAVVATTLLFAGCTTTNGSLSSDSSGGSSADSSVRQMPASGGIVSGDELAAIDPSTGQVSSGNRDVITNGSASLTVTDPIAAAQSAVTITEQAGGRIDSRTENPETETQPASANLLLRIPSADLDRTLADLKALGTVNYVSLNASDVTEQSQDLEARITALQTSVDRLLALMEQATTTADLITIETALSDRQAQLESLQSQRTALTDQIDYATLGLDLYAEGVIAAGAPDTFWSGIAAGWAALLTTVSGAVVVVGVLLPWIVAAAILGAIVLIIVKMSTRKQPAA